MRSRFLRARLGNPPARAIHDAVQLLFIALDARGVQDKYAASRQRCAVSFSGRDDANCRFYGIHTFRFVDHAGKTTNVRWRFVPEDGEKWLTDAQLAQAPREFLEAAFRDRVKQGPVRWEMIVTI